MNRVQRLTGAAKDEVLEHIERMEAFAAHAHSVVDDAEAQCVARMLSSFAACNRKRLRLAARARIAIGATVRPKAVAHADV